MMEQDLALERDIQQARLERWRREEAEARDLREQAASIAKTIKPRSAREEVLRYIVLVILRWREDRKSWNEGFLVLGVTPITWKRKAAIGTIKGNLLSQTLRRMEGAGLLRRPTKASPTIQLTRLGAMVCVVLNIEFCDVPF